MGYGHEPIFSDAIKQSRNEISMVIRMWKLSNSISDFPASHSLIARGYSIVLVGGSRNMFVMGITVVLFPVPVPDSHGSLADGTQVKLESENNEIQRSRLLLARVWRLRFFDPTSPVTHEIRRAGVWSLSFVVLRSWEFWSSTLMILMCQFLLFYRDYGHKSEYNQPSKTIVSANMYLTVYFLIMLRKLQKTQRLCLDSISAKIGTQARNAQS